MYVRQINLAHSKMKENTKLILFGLFVLGLFAFAFGVFMYVPLPSPLSSWEKTAIKSIIGLFSVLTILVVIYGLTDNRRKKKIFAKLSNIFTATLTDEPNYKELGLQVKLEIIEDYHLILNQAHLASLPELLSRLINKWKGIGRLLRRLPSEGKWRMNNYGEPQAFKKNLKKFEKTCTNVKKTNNSLVKRSNLLLKDACRPYDSEIAFYLEGEPPQQTDWLPDPKVASITYDVMTSTQIKKEFITKCLIYLIVVSDPEVEQAALAAIQSLQAKYEEKLKLQSQ